MIYDEDTLKHWGVKGMKWGVRRDRSSGSSSLKKSASNVSKAVAPTLVARFASNRVSKPVAQAGARIYNATKAAKVLDKASSRQNGDKQSSKKPGVIKEHLNSMSRERQWSKALNNIDKMTTKEVNQAVRRSQMENDFKRLSSTKKIGTSKDKEDYRRRANMSDEELNRKVSRLRAKEALSRNANEATKQQREMAKKVIDFAKPIALDFIESKNKDLGEMLKYVDKANDAQQALKKGDVDKSKKLVEEAMKSRFNK